MQRLVPVASGEKTWGEVKWLRERELLSRGYAEGDARVGACACPEKPRNKDERRRAKGLESHAWREEEQQHGRR